MSAGPERIGPYRVLRELGRGGMGVVYEVEREDTGGRFALKTITLGLNHDPELALRFAREGQLAARLDHPHVVRTHAATFEGAQPWIVQDLLPGGSLRDRLRASGPLPVDEAVEIVRKVALGLAHAHERGVIHRDVKPENVLFDDEGQPRLVDFGVSRSTVAGASSPLTATGQVIGSPAFMAPEQAIGGCVDARADVHAAGALLHTLLAGDPPFAGASTFEVLEAVISKPPRPLRSLRPDVPQDVEHVVLRALAKRPEDRFPSAAALATALGECRSSRASSPSRLVPALVAASVASTLLAVLALNRGAPAVAPPPPPDRVPTATELEPRNAARNAALAQSPTSTSPAWPGLGATFAAPIRFEVVRDIRDDKVDVFRMTFEAEPAVPSRDGLATIAMTVSRIGFTLENGPIRVDYDSAAAERPSFVDGMNELIDRGLAARVTVGIMLRTGEVTTVRGMPNAATSDIGRLGTALALSLRDDVVLNLLHNALHLFPAEPQQDSFVSTTWIQGRFGLRAPRRVRRGQDGTVQHVLSEQPKISVPEGSAAAATKMRADDAKITANARLDGDRVERSEVEVRYVDKEGAQRHRLFRFQRLAAGQ